MELINLKAHSGVSVFGGVGERTREGNDLYTEMVDSNHRDGQLPRADNIYSERLYHLHPSGLRPSRGHD